MRFDFLSPFLQKCFNECFDANLLECEKIKKLLTTAGKGKTNIYKHHIIPRSFFKMKGWKAINKGNLLKVTAFEHILIHVYYKRCARGKEFQRRMTAAFWNTFCNYQEELTPYQQKEILNLFYRKENRPIKRKHKQYVETKEIPYNQRLCFYSGNYYFVFQLQPFLSKKEIQKYILKDPPKVLIKSILKKKKVKDV